MLKNGLDIGDGASGVGLNIKGINVLLALKNQIKSKFKTIFQPCYFLSCRVSLLELESSNLVKYRELVSRMGHLQLYMPEEALSHTNDPAVVHFLAVI